MTIMTNNPLESSDLEGRDEHEVDIDRMVNEGLGGGRVTSQNGLIDDTTTETLDAVGSIMEDHSCEKT
jgi:hypothetical protein